MREILFRGKRIDNGDFIEGHLYGMWDKKYILWGQTNHVPNGEEVIPETVGQFTGLLDKSGDKIFEGDILRDGKGEDGVVTYIDSIACFMAVRDGKEAWDLNEGDPTRPNKLQYTEIIGNIHDQKEGV